MIETIEKYYRDEYKNLIKRVKYAAGSDQDAEDVVQEAFTRAIQYKESCDHTRNLPKWFSTILTNCLKDHVADNRLGGLTKNIENALPEIEPIDELDAQMLVHCGKQVDKYLVDKSDLFKNVVNMHLEYGYTAEDITCLLGIKSRSVSTYLATFYKEIGGVDE